MGMNNEFFFQYFAGLEAVRGNSAFEQWRNGLPALINAALQPERHGDIPAWQDILARLPKSSGGAGNFNDGVVELPDVAGSGLVDRDALQHLLMRLKPWRKGPYSIHGVFIDSEWRSDFKWDRLKDHISPMAGRLVLDVGCGNGYHCWRMSGAGAAAVIGIDPTLRYLMQYFAVQHFVRSRTVFVLPFALETLPDNLAAFDTVFSMGVLYHLRSPLDHLLALRSCLRDGGELVLETLVLENSGGRVLVPQDRYAQMKNVWFIPDCSVLEAWLLRCGYNSVRLIDISKTTIEEQRATPWSTDVSLADFLDPGNPDKTIEGYPAPVRAILMAKK